jgi:hypothetical protein
MRKITASILFFSTQKRKLKGKSNFVFSRLTLTRIHTPSMNLKKQNFILLTETPNVVEDMKFMISFSVSHAKLVNKPSCKFQNPLTPLQCEE